MITALTPIDALVALGLSEAEAGSAAGLAYEINVPEGWAPMWEGTVGDKVYLILEGQAVVRKRGVEIAKVFAGDIVGEGSVTDRRLRSATIVADSPLRVLTFPTAAWRELIATYPAVAARVEEIAASRR